MSSVHHLREFICERLTAAASEIFSEFEKTILRYEEELDRQRRLLDVSWKPEKLHRVDLQQEPVHKAELILTDQQLCNQERNSSLDQEEPEPESTKIKEDDQELCTSQEEDQLHLKQESDPFMVTALFKEPDQSESEPESTKIKEDDQELCTSQEEDQLHLKQETDPFMVTALFKEPDQSESEPESTKIKEDDQEICTSQEEDQLHLKQETDPFMVTALFKEPDHSESEPDGEHLISQSCAGPEDQDQDSESHDNTEWSPKTDHKDGRHGNKADQPATSEKLFSCQICGESFIDNSRLILHIKVHSVRSQNSDRLQYACPLCGKFCCYSDLVVHMRRHRGEKPFACKTCGKSFVTNMECKKHMMTHTGEKLKLYPCGICGKKLGTKGSIIVHMKRHRGEKPFSCNFCGKRFTINAQCKNHMMIHTGEKPFICQTCGRSFNRSTHLTRHMKVHTLS